MANLTISAARNLDGKLQGSYNPDDYILVTGSGFGEKNAQTPAIFETFSSALSEQLVSTYNPNWVNYDGDGAVITTQNPRYSGQKSAYNDFSRGQFFSNYQKYAQTRSVFLSYWVRTSGFRVGQDNGVLKFGRVNSSEAAGGSENGIYNGEGNNNIQSPNNFPAAYAAWSGSENAGNSLGYFSGNFPVNEWFRLEYEVHLNDVDVANGFVNFNRDVLASIQSGAIMQRKTGYARSSYLQDSTLLGLEIANPKKWYRPIVFAANTTYTVTVNGTLCSWASSASVPTANDIVTNLLLAVIASGVVTSPNTAVYQDELYIDWGKTSVYDNKFELGHVFGLQIADLYLDTSLSRFVVGNADTYSACTIKEPQVYEHWTDTKVRLIPNHAAILGTKYLYFVNTTVSGTTTTLIGASTDGINYV